MLQTSRRLFLEKLSCLFLLNLFFQSLKCLFLCPHWNLNFTLRVAVNGETKICFSSWPFELVITSQERPQAKVQSENETPKALANFLNDSLNLLWLTHTLLNVTFRGSDFEYLRTINRAKRATFKKCECLEKLESCWKFGLEMIDSFLLSKGNCKKLNCSSNMRWQVFGRYENCFLCCVGSHEEEDDGVACPV